MTASRRATPADRLARAVVVVRGTVGKSRHSAPIGLWDGAETCAADGAAHDANKAARAKRFTVGPGHYATVVRTCAP
jgi:hypothetical protein